MGKACELEAECIHISQPSGGIGAIYSNWGVGGGILNGCGAGIGFGSPVYTVSAVADTVILTSGVGLIGGARVILPGSNGCGGSGIGFVNPGIGFVNPGIGFGNPGFGCGGSGIGLINPGIGVVSTGVGVVSGGCGSVGAILLC